MSMKLAVGLYEQLVNVLIDEGIGEAEREDLQAELRELDPGDSDGYLAQYLATHIRKVFVSFPEADRLNRQIQLANRILGLLAENSPETFDLTKAKLLRAELLLAILHGPSERPDTPLSTSCLMTGTRQDPSLVSQLRKELATADQVDILCSFVKWGGVRILEESLRRLTSAGRYV
jgi:hypothetical protein